MDAPSLVPPRSRRIAYGAPASEFSRRFRPGGALLLVAGSFDTQAVPRRSPVPAPKGRELLFVSRPGAVQSVIMIGRVGMPASDPGYFPAPVANGVLGGGSAGRLMENIREDKGDSPRI